MLPSCKAGFSSDMVFSNETECRSFVPGPSLQHSNRNNLRSIQHFIPSGGRESTSPSGTLSLSLGTVNMVILSASLSILCECWVPLICFKLILTGLSQKSRANSGSSFPLSPESAFCYKTKKGLAETILLQQQFPVNSL